MENALCDLIDAGEGEQVEFKIASNGGWGICGTLPGGR